MALCYQWQCIVSWQLSKGSLALKRLARNGKVMEGGNFTVTPWEVTGEIDYDLLIENSGPSGLTRSCFPGLRAMGRCIPCFAEGSSIRRGTWNGC